MKGLSKESIPSLLMILLSLTALILSNSSYGPLYFNFWNTSWTLDLHLVSMKKSLSLWINDGLMSLFFLLVSLELKLHLKTGELKEGKSVLNPFISAIGGILIPGLVFYLFTKHDSSLVKGWAIPMATDIAFAMGILGLFGKRVSPKMRFFLLTLAIIDDVIAILIIGVFYTTGLSSTAILASMLLTCLLLFMNKKGIVDLWPYMIIGFFLWLSFLKSGLHPTLAGVIIGAVIPTFNAKGENLLKILEHKLTTFVYFIILPLFAFANMGIPMKSGIISYLTHPLILAVALGLLAGKSLGIWVFSKISERLFLEPSELSSSQVLALSFLCGIGFTMSLFISNLAFAQNQELLNIARLGVIAGSLLSIAFGTLTMLRIPKGFCRIC